MSRAFVKELDGASTIDDAPDLPQSAHPNYITPHGLVLLRERLAAAQAKRQTLLGDPDGVERDLPLAHAAREIRFLEARIERAIPVDPAGQPRGEVAFGATVRVADPRDRESEFTIVGEDEADVGRGSVSWVSPLARALMGAKVGDLIVWHRPAGDVELEVKAIRYTD